MISKLFFREKKQPKQLNQINQSNQINQPNQPNQPSQPIKLNGQVQSLDPTFNVMEEKRKMEIKNKICEELANDLSLIILSLKFKINENITISNCFDVISSVCYSGDIWHFILHNTPELQNDEDFKKIYDMFIFDIITSAFVKQFDCTQHGQQSQLNYLFSNTKLNRNIIKKILVEKDNDQNYMCREIVSFLGIKLHDYHKTKKSFKNIKMVNFLYELLLIEIDQQFLSMTKEKLRHNYLEINKNQNEYIKIASNMKINPTYIMNYNVMNELKKDYSDQLRTTNGMMTNKMETLNQITKFSKSNVNFFSNNDFDIVTHNYNAYLKILENSEFVGAVV